MDGDSNAPRPGARRPPHGHGNLRADRESWLGSEDRGRRAFLGSPIISFRTGTSWGTMAIVMPLAIPLAVKLTAFQVGMAASPVLVATVLGYLPAGFGVSPFLLLAIGALACWLLFRYRGQRAEAPAPS